MSQAAPWGRGAGEGIGLSGHKNEYKAGVRIGNWVEEQFSKEAEGHGKKMETFLKEQEEAKIAAARALQFTKNERIEPNMGVKTAMLFSHGPELGLKFGASMTALHFSDPAARAYGAESNDRVHKTFFYGSKHIDQYVPNVNPNPRMELTATKAAEWAVQKPPSLPVKMDMYNTTSLLNSYGYKGDSYVVGQGAQI